MTNEHSVTSDDDDIRLDRWFKRHFPGFPHGMLEKQLRKGSIRVDGLKAKSSDRVRFGQVIEIRIQDSAFRILAEKNTSPNPGSRILNPEDAKLIKDAILYQDDRLIIVNKPAGLATQGGSKITRSLDDMLGALAEAGERPKLTHRLDRDTSGCLVLAKNAKAATALMRLFSGRQIDKTYLALVTGVPEKLHGTVDLPIRKKDNPKASRGDGQEYEIMCVDLTDGQKAVSDYRVIDMLARKYALMELKPQTGRTHQLRVHMQSLFCPIVGDHKYGGSNKDAQSLGVEDRLHLHAWRIAIPAFGGGKAIDVKAPLPGHMKKSFKALGLDIPKR